MAKLIMQIIAGTAGLWLATVFVGNVDFVGKIEYLLLAGATLGLINHFLKPVLKAITLPLRIITLGLFTLILNMIMIWIVDIIFPELIIEGLIALFWTTLIVWAVSTVINLSAPKKRRDQN